MVIIEDLQTVVTVQLPSSLLAKFLATQDSDKIEPRETWQNPTRLPLEDATLALIVVSINGQNCRYGNAILLNSDFALTETGL